jgi:16S rRNA (guanine527-N7)-methyltransferase
MSPQEFAVRHVLESLQLLEYLPERATIADIGSGAGLPSIPCLIVRPDIEVVLIEASRKKAVFLREALKQTATSKRVHIIAERFEKVDTPEVGFVTCRALERFAETVPALLHWAPANSTILLFGGKTLQRPIEESRLASTSVQMPNSRQRFLFVINKT